MEYKNNQKKASYYEERCNKFKISWISFASIFPCHLARKTPQTHQIIITHGLFQYLILWLNIHDELTEPMWNECNKKGDKFSVLHSLTPSTLVQLLCICVSVCVQLNYWFNQRINSHAQMLISEVSYAVSIPLFYCIWALRIAAIHRKHSIQTVAKIISND